MKSRFKHFIALTTLLATGQISFGQGGWDYGPFPFYISVPDIDNDGKITRVDSAYAYNEWFKNQYGHSESPSSGNQGNYGSGGTSSQGTSSPTYVKIETTSTSATLKWDKIYGEMPINCQIYLSSPEYLSYGVSCYDKLVGSTTDNTFTINDLYPDTYYAYYKFAFFPQSGFSYVERLGFRTEPLSLYPREDKLPELKLGTIIPMVLSSVPSSAEIKWECSSNLILRNNYGSSDNHHYAYFEVSGFGEAWMKATLTVTSNGIKQEFYARYRCKIPDPDIKISCSSTEWGNFGTVYVSFPDGCNVIKWEYDENVLKKLGGNSSKVNGIITSSLSFDVLKYNTKTTIKATIKCYSSGDIYTKEIPITIKDLKISCVSATWKCNSIVEVALDNAPSNVNIIWTSSKNLNKCYHTGKKAIFQVKGTGSAWIEASFTYNGITYTRRFTYNIPGLATPVIYAPPTYTPGQPCLFSVNKVSGATSYDWQFTHAGIRSWPNDEEYGNAANIIINSQPSSQDKICKFEIRVAAKNSCGTGNYTTYTGYVPRNYSRMAHNNITDTVAIDNNLLLLSVDELNMESQESSFIVYPNPATTQLNITQTISSNALSLTKDETIKTVDIFDVKGNKCASHVFNEAQTTATIDITGLAKGIFVLVINKDSDNAWTCSFVKK